MPRRRRPDTPTVSAEAVAPIPDPVPPRRRRRPRADEIEARLPDPIISRPLTDAERQAVRDSVSTGPLRHGAWTTVSLNPARITSQSFYHGEQMFQAHVHARFSPSAAHRWLNCPRSIALHEQMQREPGYVAPPTGAAAERGRAMHANAEWNLRRMLNMPILGGVFPILDAPAEMGIVQTYVDYVVNLRDMLVELGNSWQPSIFLEQRVSTIYTDCWGTADCLVYMPPTKELWVIDFKTGHLRVSAEENEQLRIYAMGAIRDTICERVEKIHFVIVQPKDEEQPIKSWTTTRTDVTHRVGRIGTAIAEADNPDAPYRLGSHCEYCPARASCPAQRNRALSVFDGNGAPSVDPVAVPEPRTIWEINNDPERTHDLCVSDVRSLTPQQRAFFLRNSDLITGFLDAVREEAIRNPPPGFKVVEGRSRRRWRDESRLMELLQASFPELIRQQPPTLAQAERTIPAATLEPFVVTPPGALTVVPESDPRPALNGASVQVFLTENGASDG